MPPKNKYPEKLVCVALLALALVSSGSTVAYAQQESQEIQTQESQTQEEEDRGVTVLERERPEVDPLGIRLGGFLFFPKATVEQSYDDNIFFQESNKTDDFITVLKPELTLNSDFNNHELNVSVDAAISRYDDSYKENYKDYHAAVDGRFDITRDSHIFGSVDYFKEHEGRGSPNDAAGSSPTDVVRTQTTAQFFQRLNRLSFTVDAVWRTFNYDDVSAGATTINNDDRDRNEADISLRTAWEFVPQAEGFVRLAANDRSYDDSEDDAGFDRDSHGYEMVVGATLDFGGITSGDVFAGYRYQDYGDTNLKNISTPIIGAALTWNVTRLTTLTGTIFQSVEETVTANSSGYLATNVAATADHELLRNLLLNGNIGVTDNDYKGIERKDKIYQIGLGAKFMMNRYFYVSGGYNYSQRESDVTGGGDADYKQNIFNIRLEVQM